MTSRATTTSSSLSVKAAGTAQEGQTLTALAAGNDAGAVLTYQWQSSADNGTTWSAIAGATAPIYAVQESDENSIIRVIATDAADSVNTYSAPTAPVVDVYPASASVTISGLAKQGQTLDANLSVGTDSDLGTTLGIINAFTGIATKGSGNLAAVAPGVAEALVATFAGLAAAIPAVIAYNLYVNRVRLFAGELEGFANELIGTMAREGLI